MPRQVTLFHSVHNSHLEEVLRDGLKAESAFDDLDISIRQGVVYCWMCKEDDRLSSGNQRPDYVYVRVTVDEKRCIVADMDLSSLAMMYLQGAGSRPKNERAAALIGEAYEVTSVPITEYKQGVFCTPEVLVNGHIGPECIALP